MSSTAAAERKGVAMATAVTARTTRSDRTSMMRLHRTARLDCGLQGLVILAKHEQTRHTNIGETRRPKGSGPCGWWRWAQRDSRPRRDRAPESRRLGK